MNTKDDSDGADMQGLARKCALTRWVFAFLRAQFDSNAKRQAAAWRETQGGASASRGRYQARRPERVMNHTRRIPNSKRTLAIADASAFIGAVISLLTSRLTLLSGNCTGRLR